MKIIILITVVETLTLGLLMVLSYHRRQQSKLATARGRLATNDRVRNDSSSINSAHWSSINKSQLEGQRDDRHQMNGSVAITGERAASVRRAFARKSHQLMYKKWSRDRRDD